MINLIIIMNFKIAFFKALINNTYIYFIYFLIKYINYFN